MESTLQSTISVYDTDTKYRAVALSFLCSIWLLFFNVNGIAQRAFEAVACIDNNVIERKPAVCANFKALILGSRPTGGSGNYTYIWEVNTSGNCTLNGFVVIPGATGPDYNVPSTDQDGYCYRRTVVSGDCSDESEGLTITGPVNQNPALPVIQITQPTCALSTGSIQITPPAPAAGFSIDGINYSNTTGVFNGLTPKTYAITVRYASGCTSPPVSATITAPSAAPSGTINPASGTLCNGDIFGLLVTGGTAYQWYKDGVPINGATDANLIITEPGTYTADIFKNGCIGKALNESVITEAFEDEVAISPHRLTICNGGTGLLIATGGESYQWYLNGSPITGAVSSTYTVSEPGTYTIDVMKDNCTWREASSAIVEMREDLTGKVQPEAVVLCLEDSVVLQANGGITYQWYKDNVLIPDATAATYTAKAPGRYTVELFSGECKGKASNEAVVTTGKMPVGAITPASSVICENSTVNLTVTGGVSYQWYRNDSIITGATSASFAAVLPGTYTADIINQAGCRGKASNQSVVSVEPLPVGNIAPASLAICSGSKGVLKANGGTSYQWYRNGTVISGATAETLEVTAGGTYTVVIIKGSCKQRASNEVVVTLEAVPTGSISPATAIICEDGNVQLTVTGGTAYQWYKDGVPINGATQNSFTITEAGIYSADIIKGDCKGKASNEVKATVNNKPTGSISPAVASICEGNTLTLTTSGGTSYQWFKDGAVINGAINATYQAASPGQYSVTIINGNCKGAASNTATIKLADAISFSTTVVDASCTVATGTLSVNAVRGGGGTGYQYSKDNGQTFQKNNVFASLAPGQYPVVVKDEAGCKSEPVLVVIKPATNTLSAGAATTDITCDQRLGVTTITVTGGQPPYTYSVNGIAQANHIFNNLAAGTYTALVKDAAGCSTEVDFTIKEIASTLSATAAVTNPKCGEASGSVTITAREGTPDYQYSLDQGLYQAGNVFNNVTVGRHTVTVRDKTNCLYDVSFEVKAVDAPLLVVNNPSPVCSGATTSLKDPVVTSGSQAGLVFTYWSNAAATATLNNPENVGAGTYYIKGVDPDGCFAVKPVVVSTHHAPTGVIAPSNPPIVCSSEGVTLTASNGVSYQWYKDAIAIVGATAPTYKATEEGRYSVMIHDGTCLVPASNTVMVRLQACILASETKVFVPTAFTPNRNGENDVLMPYFLNVRQLVLFKVFNRWGQQVFQTNIIGEGWDGTIKGVLQPAETYSWVLECIDFDGKVIKQSGRSLLIR